MATKYGIDFEVISKKRQAIEPQTGGLIALVGTSNKIPGRKKTPHPNYTQKEL